MAARMSEAEDVSDLICGIYDAALDASLWPAVLGETCRFVDCISGTLNSYDIARSSLAINASHGYDPHYVQLLLDHYIHINPLKNRSLQTEIGDVSSVSGLADYAALMETPFWREWAKPQGYIDAMEAKLDKTPTASAALTVIRHESAGRVDEDALRRLRLLYPHFRRAVVIGKVIDLKRVEAAAFADVIDGMIAGIFLLDATGRIVYANPSGQAMLGDGELFAPDRARLTPRDPVADRGIREVLAAVDGDGEAKLGGGGIAIPLAGANGGRHIAHVLPLTSGARRAAGLHYAAVAAVFVRKAELEPLSAFETMQKTFRLTPNEVRVLEAVVEINGAAAIGAVLGMSEATVKTHLHHIFEKTGAERQADLVRLVAGYASPVSR
jgi:DNA-binding CsgD family transcriptional regulator/PAS domain-containing protein